ncbi:hypothetical protein HDU90_001151 [Geranomyces variabilis]|nr:hypothetical protein HDU90_001151 [Geranomyces variabilis]
MSPRTNLVLPAHDITHADLSSAVIYAGCFSLFIVLVVKSFCDRCLDPGSVVNQQPEDARRATTTKLEVTDIDAHHQQQQPQLASRRRRHTTVTTDESFFRANGRESLASEGLRGSIET